LQQFVVALSVFMVGGGVAKTVVFAAVSLEKLYQASTMFDV
jgi:hypothetical protein